jgi:hypothetical protein
MMTYLTSTDAHTSPNQYRCFAEVASIQTDYEGIPEFWRVIDLVVAQPTEEAIKSAIAECEWLDGFELVSYWEPDYMAPF